MRQNDQKNVLVVFFLFYFTENSIRGYFSCRSLKKNLLPSVHFGGPYSVNCLLVLDSYSTHHVSSPVAIIFSKLRPLRSLSNHLNLVFTELDSNNFWSFAGMFVIYLDLALQIHKTSIKMPYTVNWGILNAISVQLAEDFWVFSVNLRPFWRIIQFSVDLVMKGYSTWLKTLLPLLKLWTE